MDSKITSNGELQNVPQIAAPQSENLIEKSASDGTELPSAAVVVYSSGTVISSGAEITGETLVSGGNDSMYVSSGGTANCTTVNSGGRLLVASNGMAEETFINAGGSMYISSGGSASKIAVQSGGRLGVNGCAYYVDLYEGASLTTGGISAISGYTGYIGYFTQGSTGYQLGDSNANLSFSMACTLIDNAYLENAIICGGGLSVKSGGQVVNVTLENGKLSLQSGAVVSNVFVNNTSSGMLDLYSYSGSIANVNLQNNGRIWGPGGKHYIYAVSGNSGHIDNLIIANSAMSWQGKAEYIRLTGKSMAIGEEASLENSEIALDLNVSSGAVVSDCWQTSGMVLIYSGATVSNYSVLGGWADVMNGSAANLTLASGGYFKVYSSGSVSNVFIEDKSHLAVYSGTASNVFISSGGSMVVSSGGAVHGTLQIESGAVVSASKGTIVDFTVANHSVDGGFLINDLSLIAGTPTFTITVSADQTLGTYQLAQGAENFTGSISIGDGSVNYGAITVNGEKFVYDSKYYKLKENNGDLTLTIADSSAVPSVFVYSSGTLTSSGAEITGETLFAGGNDSMYVSSGGTANCTTVNSGGRLLVASNGMAEETFINAGGSMYISSGGSASKIAVQSGGQLDVNGCAYYVDLYEGASLTTGGKHYIYAVSGNSGHIDNLIIANSAMSWQGKAEYIRLTGKSMTIGEKASLENSEIALDLRVSSGAVVSDCWQTSGMVLIYSGATVSNYSVLGGWADVMNGSAANLTLASGGYFKVYSNGSVSNVFIEDKSHLGVYSGTASNVFISSGGSMVVSSGGAVHGTLQIESGAVVSASDDAIFDFTVANHSVDGGFLINDLSLIYGKPTFTITVSADQALGEYKLTQNVSYFIDTISVGDGSVNYGSVTVNGEDLFYDSKYYSLREKNGVLTLSVADTPTPPPSVFLYNSSTLVSSGREMTGVTLGYYSGNSMHVSSNGVANSTTVSFGGSMHVSSGGSANNTTVISGGSMLLFSGASASDTIVSRGGFLRLERNTFVSGLTVESHGTLYLTQMAISASDLNISDGARLFMTIGSQTYLQGAFNGSAFEVKDGQISGFNFVDGRLILQSSAFAQNISAMGSASIIVNKNAVIESAFFQTGNHTASDQGKIILSGGTARYTSLTDYAGMEIYSGTASDTYLANSAFLIVSSGATVSRTQIDQLGSMYVSSGARAEQTVLNSGGSVYFESGASLIDTVVNSGGYVSLYNVAAEGVTINNGGYVMFDFNHTAEDVLINSGGTGYFASGSAEDAIVVSSGGKVAYVANGVYTGDFDLKAGGVFMGISFFGDRELSFTSGTSTYLAPRVYLTSRINDRYENTLRIQSNGSMSEFVAHSSSYVVLMSGAYAENFIIDGAYMFVSGGTASNVVIDNFGSAAIRGAISNLTVNGSCIVMAVDGGTIDGLVTSNGSARIRVSSGGTVRNAIINELGVLFLNSGATAENIEQRRNARMTLIEGAALTGNHTWGGQVNISGTVDAQNANIELDISDHTTSDKMIIRGFNYLEGVENLTITVDVDQTLGSYKIASGIQNFTAGVTLKDTDDFSYGVLSSGSSIMIGEHVFSLIVDETNDMLSLFVENDITAPVISKVSIAQDEAYTFTAAVSADDDFSNENELSYLIRWAESTEDLTEVEFVEGKQFVLSPEMAGRDLYYQVAVADKYNNTTLSTVKLFNVEDRTAPELTGSVNVGYDDFTLRFDWEKTADNCGAVSYQLSVNGTVYHTSENYLLISNILPGTYAYELQAADSAGNVSTQSISGTVNIEGRAELAVDSLRVLKEGNAVTSIFNDDETTLALSVSNTGSKTIPDAVVKVYCGDTLLTTLPSGSIAAGETLQLNCVLSGSSLKVGINELKVIIDTGDSSDEYSKLNNEKTTTLIVEEKQKSDLVIGSIALDKAMYALGDTAKLSFAVKNTGYGESKATTAVIYSGETLLGRVDISALKSGESSELLSFEIPTGSLTAGTHLLRIVADAGELENESSEINNTSTINMVVGGCDLNLNRLDLSLYDCTTKDDLTVRFTVVNSGTVSAGSFRVNFYDGETYLGSTVIAEELAAGFSISGQYLIKAGLLAPGVHNIKAVALLEGDAVETNKLNNTLSAQTEVVYKDEKAPVLTELSVSQSPDGYLFTVNASASDDVSSAEELTYALRIAESAGELSGAEIITGSTFTLDAAQAGKNFFYQLAVTDSAGNTLWSDINSLTVADTTGPEIKNIQVNADEGVFTLTWESVDNVQISHFNVYVDGVLQAQQTTTTFELEGLESADHTYRIEAFDTNGNSSSTPDLEMEDETAPGINYLSIQQLSGTYTFAIDVQATDDFTPQENIVYSVKYATSEELLATAAAIRDLNVVLTEKDAGKTLYYQVGVSDATGNTFWSSIRTVKVSDITSPGKGAGLNSEVNEDKITLQWTPASDNTSVEGYNVRYGQTSDLSGYGVWTSGTSLALENLAAGKYFWQVSAIDSAGNMGAWSDCASFTVYEPDPFEINNTPQQAFDLGVLEGTAFFTGGTISSANDEDWFSVTLASKGVAGDTISIEYDALYGELGLYLYSSDGTTQLISASNGTLALNAAEAGTYMVKVTGLNGARNSYTLKTQKFTEYAVDINDSNGGNNSIANATIIDIGSNPSGTLEGMNIHSQYDTDFYKFTLSDIGQANESVSISFKHKQGDLDLYLLNSSGEIIDQSIKTGNNEKISFKGLSAGTYYIQVAAPHGACNEYDLNWKFSPREVMPDSYEGKEPVEISNSCDFTGLTISQANKTNTREDTFVIRLDAKGNSSSRIRFSNYRSDWEGVQYTLCDSNGNTLRSGTGAELSLNGIAAGSYTLRVDTPVSGSYGSYDMSVSLPEIKGDSWTVFVYMAADNNLDQYAIDTLFEMQKANLDAGVEVYILLDRAADSGSWSDTRVGKLCYSTKDTVDIVWESWGELNSGSPDTLERFLEWGVNQAPDSENYSLIMWNHGGGIAKSMNDDSSNSQGMLPQQIADVIKNCSADISVVGFDACLMGMAEVISCFDGITEYFVGSEEMEGSSGWDWARFLTALSGSMSPEEFAAAAAGSVEGTDSVSVLTAVKTDGTITDALCRFAEKSAEFTEEEWELVSRAFIINAFGGVATDKDNSQISSYADLISVADFMLSFQGISDSFAEVVLELKESVAGAIIRNCTNLADGSKNGVSFYTGIDVNAKYEPFFQILQDELEATPLGQESSWSKFINDLADVAEKYLDSNLLAESSKLHTQTVITNDKTFNATYLGAFSGNGFTVTADDFFSADNTRIFMFDITQACGNDDMVIIDSLFENGEFSVSLYDSAMQTLIASVESQEGIATLDLKGLAAQSSYIFTVTTEQWQSYDIKFAGSSVTGCDYYDYSAAGVNDKNVNGNSCIEKATRMQEGLYSGLMTYSGDADWFSCGDRMDEEKLITVIGSGLTVAEYDAQGNKIQDALYEDGVYSMTVKAANFLYIEGNADISSDQVNSYQLYIKKLYNAVDYINPELTITGLPADWVNSDVTLTASSNEEGTVEYSYNNIDWFEGTEVVVTENTTVWFRATDKAGNVTTESVDVDKIDKTAPIAPVVSADITELTNSAVTLTVDFGDAPIKEYSFNGRSWKSYTSELLLSSNTPVYFRGTDLAGNVSETTLYRVSNIDKNAPALPMDVTVSINKNSAFIDWNDVADSGMAGVKGYIFRYSTSESLDGEGTLLTESQILLEGLERGVWYYQIASVDNLGNTSEWSAVRSFVIAATAPENLTGTAAGLSWDAVPGAAGYVVEYSTDDFETVISIETDSNAIDALALPESSFKWRVRTIESSEWVYGEEITGFGSAEAELLVSDADNSKDLFFANAAGTWSKGYAAEHQITGERVMLAGKNKIDDIFEGSADANVLVLSDDANGDALFVDDIYTALGDQARFSQIDGIRAGAGDDIVDMTSTRYAYEGSSIKIYGGSGNDTIWAGAESNTLFGDAGNDRLAGASGNDILVGGSGNDSMHGGGGDDIFAFGGDWGVDTVQQLAGGSVTLWFEEGSESNWDATTMTYSDGVNSVTVTGVTEVTLKFGADAALPEGSFCNEASEKIFEDKSKGMIA